MALFEQKWLTGQTEDLRRQYNLLIDKLNGTPFLPSTGGYLAGHLLPSVTATYDLGSAAYRWRTLYLSADVVSTGSFNFSTAYGGTGLYMGNGDGAVEAACNMDLQSWQGIGIKGMAGNPYGNGTRTVWINARNGNINTKGDIYSNTSHKVWNANTLLSSSTTMSYGSSFANPGGGTWETLKCARIGNAVILSGHFYKSSTTIGTLCTLPTGYRPSLKQAGFIRSYEDRTHNCNYEINTNGTIVIEPLDTSGGILKACSLTGISFVV